MSNAIPTLHDWLGGSERLHRLTDVFYAKVRRSDLLAPVFSQMPGDHPRHVAQFIGEVFGGPRAYSGRHGSDAHRHMISQHLGRHLTEPQRRTWVGLLLEAADEVGLPDDPEFRSAFLAYIEWGTRIAVINSQQSTAPDASEPMPQWGWGEVGGPYRPPNTAKPPAP